MFLLPVVNVWAQQRIVGGLGVSVYFLLTRERERDIEMARERER